MFEHEGDRPSTRVAVFVGSYLLHAGHFDAAARLSRSRQRLLHTEEGQAMCTVAGALAACNSKPAVTWCKQHRGKLRRVNSPLLFNLLLRETVESSRRGIVAAIEFAREHLSGPCVAEFNGMGSSGPLLRLQAAQRALGALVVRGAADPGARAWARLASQFEVDSRTSQSVPKESALEVCLRVGLSALKTNACSAACYAACKANAYSATLKPNTCPICSHPPFRFLQRQIPLSCVTHSFLRYRMSRLGFFFFRIFMLPLPHCFCRAATYPCAGTVRPAYAPAMCVGLALPARSAFTSFDIRVALSSLQDRKVSTSGEVAAITAHFC